MKVRYTPGTSDGLVGKAYNVEIVNISLIETQFVSQPILDQVTIRYEDGKTETISGAKLFDSINMVQTSVSKRVH
jgi:hypothetical protein